MKSPSVPTERFLSVLSWALLAVFALFIVSVVGPLPGCSYTTKNQQERRTMKGLELAVRGYQVEYGGTESLNEFWRDERTPIPSEGEFLKVLMGEHDRLNLRKIRYWEPPAGSSGSRRPHTVLNDDGILRLVDRHGNPYWMLLDLNGDGRIPHPGDSEEGDEIGFTFIIYSGGGDGNPSSWKDNITNWQ